MNARPPILLLAVLAILGIALVVLIVNHQGGFSFGLANADFARIVTLVVILLAVGAAVLGRPLRAFEIVRSMVVWAAIILVIAGMYASRDELAGFAGRLLGALAPGLPITGRMAGDTNPDSVVVVRSDDGHFGVRGSVDGISLTLLVDTGASFVTLTHQDALRVGIPADRLDYVIPIRTANGPMTAAAVIFDSVAVGTIERKLVRGLVAPVGSLEQSLLGMTFLDTLNGYAISGDRLTLTP